MIYEVPELKIYGILVKRLPYCYSSLFTVMMTGGLGRPRACYLLGTFGQLKIKDHSELSYSTSALNKY